MTSQRPAILFLMSDARLRDVYVSRFERDGWTVDTASSLLDAERRAVQLRPAVFFIQHAFLEDAKLAFKRLRSLPTLLKTRIVVADKHLARQDIDTVLAAGAHEVIITAHCSPDALLKRMNQLTQASL